MMCTLVLVDVSDSGRGADGGSLKHTMVCVLSVIVLEVLMVVP